MIIWTEEDRDGCLRSEERSVCGDSPKPHTRLSFPLSSLSLSVSFRAMVRRTKTQRGHAQSTRSTSSESEICSNVTSPVKMSKRRPSTSTRIKTSRKRDASPESSSSEDPINSQAQRKKSKRASRALIDVSRNLRARLSRLTEEDLRVLVHGLRRASTGLGVGKSRELDDASENEDEDEEEAADEDQVIVEDVDEDDQREIEERA